MSVTCILSSIVGALRHHHSHVSLLSNTVPPIYYRVLRFEMMCCEGCWKEEREALLGLNSRFQFPLSWEWDGTDCCEWERVECNSSTGRVVKLNLYYMSSNVDPNEISQYNNWYLNYSDFIVFKDLKSLNLSLNMIAGCADNEDYFGIYSMS
ncbi:hypothetical protein CR513_28062, partial [Mucuna pruriens]